MGEMDLGENHTLFIPTFNRPDHLQRLIQYYRTQAPSMCLLVLDTSQPEIAQRNGTWLSSLGNAVSHKIYPQSMMLMRKLNEGLTLVKTPYVSFCADDDVIFPTGIRAAISFLHHNRSYSTAHGVYLNFRVSEHDVLLNSEYTGESITDEAAGARIFALCQKYESLFYAVYRTADARKTFSFLVAISTTHYQELFQSAATLILGKAKRLPVFYGARQSGPPAQADLDKWQTFHWFADNPSEVLDSYTTYRSLLWDYYQMHGAKPQLVQQQFLTALDLAHAVYFSAGCSPEYFFSRLQPLWPSEQYLRRGRLDTLPEARKLLYVKRHFWPGRQQANDILDQMRLSSRLGAWSRDGLVGGLRFLFQTAMGCVVLLGMRARFAIAARQILQCHLPGHLVWMAGRKSFRDAYKELCVYLR